MINMIKIKLRELTWDNFTTATSIHNATGISKAMLSDIIRGKHTNVRLETINKLCKFFDCSISDILEYIPD